jgi:hypothetical protein
MAQNLSRLPNYTCIQTIERAVRRAPSRKLLPLDRLRLEVALVNGKEMFSWPGSGNFEDKSISELVGGGMIATGTFALHAKAVFQSKAPEFTYAGRENINEVAALRWNFVVPRNRSGYFLRSGTVEARVAYRGAFWVEASSLEVIQLLIEAQDLPRELDVRQSSEKMLYQKVPIVGTHFLLPASSELDMVDTQDNLNRNTTKFSSCRQYTGESVVSFDDIDTATAAQNDPPRSLRALAGVELDFVLETPISGPNSAVGDPVLGTLKKPAKIANGYVAPKGAEVIGRISFLRTSNDSQTGSLLGIDFFELRDGNTRVRLRASLEYVPLFSSPRFRSWMRGRSQFGNNSAAQSNLPGNVFYAPGFPLQLDRGVRMIWRTEPLQTEDKQ